MSPKKGVLSRAAVLAGMFVLASVALPQTSRAQDDVFWVNHFDVTKGDGTVRTINPNTTSAGILCEMVYVFDAHEEMQECCGCPVTNDGLRVQSTITNLTANPLSGPGTNPKTGVIKIVSSAPNASTGPYAPCNPAVSVSPTPNLRSFSTHTYSNGLVGITETEFEEATLTTSELSALQSTCAFIHINGTGSGICTCGTGDNFAPTPGAGGR